MKSAREEQILQKSKDRLKKEIDKTITRMFHSVLDMSEVAIGDTQRFRPLRSKILRSGNDAIRELKLLIDKEYDVLFVPSTEDVVEIQQSALSLRKVDS